MKPNADELQIRKAFQSLMQGGTEGDLDSVLRLLAEDVVFFLPGRPALRGRDPFAATFRETLKHSQIQAAFEIQDIRIADGHAYCWSQLSLSITPRRGGLPKRRAGSVLAVFRKDPDDSWRLFHYANLFTEV